MRNRLSRAVVRCGSGLLVLSSVLALTLGTTITAGAITAPPPRDCNTPNQSGGIGVLASPQNMDTSGHPFLTKTLTGTTPGGYSFDVVTSRNAANDAGGGSAVSYTATTLTDTSKTWTTNQWAHATVLAGGSVSGMVASNTANTLTITANWSSTPPAQTSYVISFFSEILDCAWDVTQGGSAATANYATQTTAPVFRVSDGRLTIALDVNGGDAICDRVEVKGTDSSGVAFTDNSNLVGSPAGTACSVSPAIPEAPTTALLLVAAGGGGAIWYATRRRRGMM